MQDNKHTPVILYFVVFSLGMLTVSLFYGPTNQRLITENQWLRHELNRKQAQLEGALMQ